MNPQPKITRLSKLLAAMTPDAIGVNVDSGQPEWFSADLVETEQFASGVWRCSPGGWSIKSYSVNEVMHILKGRFRLTDHEGNVSEVSAGDVIYMPKGWQGRWDTIEEVEKIYFILF